MNPLYEALEEGLGFPGRLLSASKSYYREENPTHRVFFNACVFDPDGTQVWYGDVDLDVDKPTLQRISEEVGPLILTAEMPFRFDGLQTGRVQRPTEVVEFPR